MPDPAGYSGTPLPRKLGIAPGRRVLLDGAPPQFETTHLVPAVAGVDYHRRAGRDPYDVIVAFRRDRAGLLGRLDRDISRTATDGALWICWPKRSSGVVTDITEDVIRAAALDAGVVDVKVCAVDEVWSGLKLVRRRRDR